MSTGRGSSGGGEAHPIPAGSRKMVQSLKEIVNCSEAEIYATLKDCNMDPNEAVNRLIFQDPFHEVKSKREKKKEGKDTESKPRSGYNNSNRCGKNVVDRYPGRSSLTPNSSSECAPSHGKLAFKKENGSTMHSSSLCSVPVVTGSNRSIGPPGPRNDGIAENKGSTLGTSDGETFGTQPPGYQSAWVGAQGQVSMADIVKMGRPHDKASSAASSSHYNMNRHNVQGPTTSALLHNLTFFEDHASNVHETGVSSPQKVPSYSEWSSIEKPADTNVLSFPDCMDSELHQGSSDLLLNGIDQQFKSEEIQKTEDKIENPGGNDEVSFFNSGRDIPEDDSRSASLSENDLHENMASDQPNGQDFKHHEDEEVGTSIASVTRNFQQINIKKDGRGLPSEADVPSVIIPDHLLAQTVDCSHLSFGSFGSGISSAYSSAATTSLPVKTNLEDTHREADVSSVGYLDTRNTDFFVGDSVTNASDGDMFHRSVANTGNHDASSVSQPENLKPENVALARGNHYSFPALNPDYTYDEVPQLNAAFSQPQTSSQMQNLSPFTNVMSHTNSLPSTLLASNVPPSRESDLQYSPFPMAQSVSSKYGSSVSSIGSSAISISEALKIAGFSSMQSAPLSLSGTNIATGPPLPQHLAVHPYSQPTLPLGPYANMIGYPFLPQSYTLMPSAFQQTLTGSGAYHQSLAGMLPQYKNNISVGSLGQSSGIASGYAAFGNTTTIPGNFLMNPSALSGSTSYDDASISQFKESSHLMSLQQNGNSGLWHDGPNSRMMSAVPTTALHNYQGQNQQPGGFRQGQQPSQDYGTPGFPNFYHSQVGGASLDQQPQNPRDGSLGSSQGQPKQPQIWQNGY